MIANVKLAIRKAGFEFKTPVIDLTGQSLGILYAIESESIGQAWTIGGYPGSLKLAEAVFERITCEKISKDWILFEQGGPRSISNELIQSLGAYFPNSFELVGKWQTAEGAGGYPVSRTQERYKPVKPSEKLNTCMRLRKSQGQKI